MAEDMRTAWDAGTKQKSVAEVPGSVQEDRKLSDAERFLIRRADASAKTMQDFTSPEELYGELVAGIRKYHPSDDISMIEKAYRIAYDAHKDQKRKSG
ncbi:MAG TPA: hypothetical protein DHV42_02800, partial [Lachnospiraceae bacterium]|nr:hypothetical protein [Lachnospiraceae bacterium]